jgi:hypothetical protein
MTVFRLLPPLLDFRPALAGGSGYPLTSFAALMRRLRRFGVVAGVVESVAALRGGLPGPRFTQERPHLGQLLLDARLPEFQPGESGIQNVRRDGRWSGHPGF